jgi:hypothetical protein
MGLRKIRRAVILSAMVIGCLAAAVGSAGDSEAAVQAVKGKVIMTRGKTVVIELEDTRRQPARGDTVELSFSAGGEAVPVGTWRVSRVEEDGTVEAEPVDALGEPSLGMDARILLEHEERTAVDGGGEQKGVVPAKGAKLWIGLRTRPADERDAPGLDLAGGELVVKVHEDSPAGRAGLEKGDVVLRIDRHPVTKTQTLSKLLKQRAPGDRIDLSYWRAGEIREVPVVLVAKDRAALYAKGCAQGDADACNRLGIMYAKGDGVAKDIRRAIELYRKACEAGDAWGCNNLAFKYKNGNGLKKDMKQAAALFEKACMAGNGQSCNQAGRLYERGNGLTKDQRRAVYFYEKGCRQENWDSCLNLGVMCAQGRGTKRDYERAVNLFEKACEAGKPMSCGNLGVMYGRGLGVKVDHGRAAELYEQACKAGEAVHCGNLGVKVLRGEGVPRDIARAKELLRKGCDDGHTEHCDELKKIGK